MDLMPNRTQNLGTAALRFPLIDWRMVNPVLPAISTVLLLFLLSTPFLLFAFFAAIAHGNLFSFSLREAARFCSTPKLFLADILGE
jgi:hypothetical protein